MKRLRGAGAVALGCGRAQILVHNLRPAPPPVLSKEYMDLVESLWSEQPHARPDFSAVIDRLDELKGREFSALGQACVRARARACVCFGRVIVHVRCARVLCCVACAVACLLGRALCCALRFGGVRACRPCRTRLRRGTCGASLNHFPTGAGARASSADT